jgi:hypothetical protein
MATTPGQTSYVMFPDFAQPGQLADHTMNEIASFTAAEVINPGRAVEIAADGLSVQQVQQTGTTFNPVGISVLLTAREGAGAVGIAPYGIGGAAYAIGDTVPVLLRGRIYAEWSGTTQPSFAAIDTFHSSTISTNRGKFTDAGTSAGAGVEIATHAAFRTRMALPNSGTIILIDVNLPGAQS